MFIIYKIATFSSILEVLCAVRPKMNVTYQNTALVKVVNALLIFIRKMEHHAVAKGIVSVGCVQLSTSSVNSFGAMV